MKLSNDANIPPLIKSRVDESISWTNSFVLILEAHVGMFVQVTRSSVRSCCDRLCHNVQSLKLTYNNVINQVNETCTTLVSRSVLRRIALLIDSFVIVSAREAAPRYINWKRINVRCSLCYRLSSQLRTSIRALREKSSKKLDFF